MGTPLPSLQKRGHRLSQNWPSWGGGGVEDFLLEIGGKGLIGVGFKIGTFMIFLIYFLVCEFFLFANGIDQ